MASVVAGHNGSVRPEELLADAPTEVGAGAASPGGVRYELTRELIATHGEVGPGPPTLTLEGGAISVHPIEAVAAAALAPDAVGPVYRRSPGGGIAVPTGRVLVRFADGDWPERHREGIAEAGYEIEQVLAYAPQAGWVRARSGRITDSLARLRGLEALPGVENVEVQMVSPASRRE